MQENTTPPKKKMSIWLKFLIGLLVLGFIGKLIDHQPKTTTAQAEVASEANKSTMEANEPVIEVNEATEEAKTDEEDPYQMMHIAFEGMPEIEDFKPMLHEVMTRYGFEINRENLMKVGSVLVTMRKESKVGVTETELLKHIYQHGASQITFPQQAGISATILESTK